MVLPTPPPDDAPREGAWLEEIHLELRLVEKGLLVLVDHARPERLRDLVCSLLPEYPELEVYTDVRSVYEVPEGSVMILAPRAEDADWLNLHRPVFARRELKVILWCDEATSLALVRHAFDFFDWISHRHECPPGVAMHAVFGIRAAHRAGAPAILWTGGDLEACFRAALPDERLVHLDAKRPYAELVQAVRDAGDAWIVWHDPDDYRPMVVDLALAEGGGRARSFFVADSWPSWHPPVHGLHAALVDARHAIAQAGARAPGRLAALAGLEPEAITAIVKALHDARYDEAALTRILQSAEDPYAALEPTCRSPRRRDGEYEVVPFDVLARQSPADPSFLLRLKMQTAMNMTLVADYAAKEGDLHEAEIIAKRAVELTAQVLGEHHLLHAHALHGLARVFTRRGLFRDAEPLLRRAAAISEDLVLPDLADVLLAQGRYAEAEQVAARALEVARKKNAGIQQAEETLAHIRSLLARM